MNRVDREVEEEARTPPRNAFITGVRRRAFHQRQQGDSFALFVKLPGDFIRHVAAQAIAAQIIRAARLHRADFLDVMRRHVFDASKLLQSPHAARFQAVHRLVGAQMRREIRVGPEVAAARAMHEENRRLDSFGLNRHQRRTGHQRLFLAKQMGQLLDGGRLEQRGEREFFAKIFLHLGK